MAGATLSEQDSSITPPPAFARTEPEKLWRGSAPEQVKKLWRSGARADAWERYRQDLAKQVSKDRLKESFGRLRWGLVPDASDFVVGLGKAAKRGKVADLDGAATDWLDSVAKANGGLPTASQALDAVAWGHVVVYAPGALPCELWLQVLDTLTSIATSATESRPSLETADASRILTDSLLAGELPLLLGTGLDAIRPLRELRSPASDLLSEALSELCDGEGVLLAKLLEAAPALFASWTRCRLLDETASRGPWNKEAQDQYEWLIRHLLRLSGEDGKLLLSPCGDIEDALAEALAVDGDTADNAAAELRLRFDLDAEDDKPPAPSAESEWAECAVLAAGWAPKSPVIAVAWDRPTMHLAIRSDKRTLIEGEWPLVVRRNGQLLAAADEWDLQCWYSDQDCDYLELATELHDGVKLERQVILGRQHGVLAIGEVVVGGGDEASWEVETRLPMTEAVSFVPEKETLDGVLMAGKLAAAAVLPCSLPEWRADRHEGDLTAVDGVLRLLTLGAGRNLSSLLWIDLSSKRFLKQRTWRRLTVAQSLQKVARDVAAGYRVQSGKEQWLYYRSLDAAANRTVLGQNLSSEAFVGRFLPTGEVDEYFEIEADD